MENPALVLAVFGWPVGMGLMMWFMGRQMGMGKSRHENAESEPGDSDPEKRLAVLQAERELVDAQLALLEASRLRDEQSAVRGEARR